MIHSFIHGPRTCHGIQYHIVQRLLYVYTTVRFVHGAKLSFQMESVSLDLLCELGSEERGEFVSMKDLGATRIRGY